jgi:hypothetical protein
VTNAHQKASVVTGKVAGPRGFEPRVSGFGGLRTVLVEWFGALIQSGLRTLFPLIQFFSIN